MPTIIPQPEYAVRRTSRKRVSRDDDDNNEGNNPKRTRGSKYNPDQLLCLPCAIWTQSCSDTQLQQFHPVERSRHAASDALSLSQYASYGNVNFHLENGDCVCQPCYRDYMRNRHNRENTVPRWAKIKTEYYAQQVPIVKHCIYCCGSVCECDRIHQWGPDNWHGEESISMYGNSTCRLLDMLIML